MAYQTGTSTNLADLLSKLNTFATANGWTSDEFDTVNGDWALSKNNIYVSARWDVSSPNHLALYQALAFDGTATKPGDHTDDSGHGYNATTANTDALLDDERCVNDLGNGPYTSYHFFENDASPAYIHVVVQSSPNIFKHFGFGEINKFGDWTGGEYCYGYYQGTGANQNAISSTTCNLFDGVFAGNFASTGQRSATMHVEGLPNQAVGDKWGAVNGSRLFTNLASNTDGNGNALAPLLGGFRGGPVARWWGHFSGSNSIGFLPGYPIHCWHYDIANARARFLGNLPDIRGVDLRNFGQEEEVVVGSDTWVLFPSGRRTSDNVSFRTYFQGVAYKKVTT